MWGLEHGLSFAKGVATVKIDFDKLDRAFSPRAVAVVGDSKATNFEWLRGQLKFKGKLYSVHVNPDTAKEIEALGVKNYSSLLDVPEPVDLAIVAVARRAALGVLEDCIRKEVAAAHFFAAGFSETLTPEGIELERQLTARAEDAGFLLIGPNCMGLFNPRVGIRQSEDQYLDVWGPVGFLSQSGSIAIAFSLDAYQQGVYLSKSVSYGNGIAVDSPDFVEYFGRDPEIKVIGMYIEGVKDGRRFFNVLREVASKKAVVIWKGGRTEEGNRAIASHTGSLALSRDIWDAAIRQCGAIQVSSMEELIDTIKALLFLPPVRGRRVAIAGGPGGQSVIATDIFAEVGLEVPKLTQESYAELETFFEVVGGSYRNPIDTAGPVRRDMRRIMSVVSRDANIDNIAYIVSTRPGWHMRPQQIQGIVAVLEEVKKQSKPLIAMVFLHVPDSSREVADIILKLQEHGIPAFPSISRGARALKNVFDYYSRRESGG